MILLHHPEVELSRELLAALPEGVDVIDCSLAIPDNMVPEYPVSAFPSVVVDVPAYTENRPLFAEDGSFLGMERVTVQARQEPVRMPASWAAVDGYVEYVAARAAANPPE
ncbi:MAG: hypothetical protein KKA55_01925 [Proteobacteria bacterium]|nr:hypothetical protein [Pseudomonadota bacterium]MBU1594277.1 hypothetical protein [Pseudomonadota bacterium]